MTAEANRPDLTIIIPVYKGKDYIREQIASICGITHSFEVLMLVDGSPDDSYACCRDWFSGDPRIKVINEEVNAGIAATRNKGLKAASGRYLMFADQDDLVEAEVIDRALTEADERELDLVIWSTRHLFEDGSTAWVSQVLKEAAFSGEEIREVLVGQLLLHTPTEYVTRIHQVWAGLFRTEMIQRENIHLKRFVYIEDDIIFMFDALMAAQRVLLIPEAGYNWRKNMDSESHRKVYIHDYLAKGKRYYGYYRDQIREKGCPDLLRQEYAYFAHQTLAIYGVTNVCVWKRMSQVSRKELLEFLRSKECRDAFAQKKYALLSTRQEKISYFLLKAGLLRGAMWYNYLDSVRYRDRIQDVM